MKPISFFLIFCWTNLVFGQQEADTTLTTDNIPLIELNTENRLLGLIKLSPEIDKYKDAVKKGKDTYKAMKDLDLKKTKENRSEYKGFKVKKSFIRTQKGKKNTVEKFHYLTETKLPPSHVQNKYFYLKDKRKIQATEKNTVVDAYMLHGHYEKEVNGEIVEEGYYYLGVKDGKWERFDKDFVLQEKLKYEKGFLKESQISYHDDKKTRIKEVIPIHNGVLNGDYYRFFPSTRLAEKGRYADGVKVGKWFEYYDREKQSRKAEIMHRKNPFDENFQSYTLKAWDEKGKPTVNNPKK